MGKARPPHRGSAFECRPQLVRQIPHRQSPCPKSPLLCERVRLVDVGPPNFVEMKMLFSRAIAHDRTYRCRGAGRPRVLIGMKHRSRGAHDLDRHVEVARPPPNGIDQRTELSFQMLKSALLTDAVDKDDADFLDFALGHSSSSAQPIIAASLNIY